MSKRELIDRIRILNPTAPSRFLAQFDEADLGEYLEHLSAILPPPGGDAFYRVRPLGEPMPAPMAYGDPGRFGGAEQDRPDPRQLALAF